MLILSRRAAERIYLGDDIVLTIVAVGADKVRIGVKAPAGVRILRNELNVADRLEKTPSLEAAEAPVGDETDATTLLFSDAVKKAGKRNTSQPRGETQITATSDGQEIRDIRSFMTRRKAA